jgi:hypothetical protein
MKPRCYVCGKPLDQYIMLVSLSQEVDRVFLAHPICSQRMDDALFLKVRRVS